MSNAWSQVALTELVTQRRDAVKIESGVKYRLLGVRWYGEGAFHRETVTRETSKATTVYRVTPGQFIYNRLFAGKGAFGLVTADFAGAFVSNEFPLFDTDTERLSVDYLNLYFQQRPVWDFVETVSTGTTASRNRWKESQFLTHQIPLPSLPVQQRIVEIISAMDEHVAALEVEAGDLLRVRNAVLGEMLSHEGESWRSAPLAEAGTLERGRRFVKSDYSASGLGCIHYGQIYTDYGATATRTVTYLPESFRDSMRLAQPGDVVIAGTSENIEDVGKAVAWLGEESVAVHDDCFIFRHELDPKFVSYFFASPQFQHRKRQFTSVTKVVRISAANLKKIVMPLPPREEQERLSRVASAMDAQVASLRAEAERVLQMRVTLLSGLMNRTIDVKSAEFMEV